MNYEKNAIEGRSKRIHEYDEKLVELVRVHAQWKERESRILERATKAREETEKVKLSPLRKLLKERVHTDIAVSRKDGVLRVKPGTGMQREVTAVFDLIEEHYPELEAKPVSFKYLEIHPTIAKERLPDASAEDLIASFEELADEFIGERSLYGSVNSTPYLSQIIPGAVQSPLMYPPPYLQVVSLLLEETARLYAFMLAVSRKKPEWTIMLINRNGLSIGVYLEELHTSYRHRYVKGGELYLPSFGRSELKEYFK